MIYIIIQYIIIIGCNYTLFYYLDNFQIIDIKKYLFFSLVSTSIAILMTKTTKVNYYQKYYLYVIQPFIKSLFISLFILFLIVDDEVLSFLIKSISLSYIIIFIGIYFIININRYNGNYKLKSIYFDDLHRQEILDDIKEIKISNFVQNKKINFNKLNKNHDQTEIIVCNGLSKKKINKTLIKFYECLIPGGYLIVDISKLKLNKIELLGRLSYIGFDYEFDDKFNHIVLRKMYKRLDKIDPTENFIISLDRVGLFGKNLKIYKFRSMYPYSEFLHNSLLDNENLSSIGKIEKDPRITKIGKIIRKYWIDELPQIYNWLRGDIKLVGIRAMSYPFFNKYPIRYQKKYLKVKPGFICPIFDEKTTGFNEIVKIEERYLDSYIDSPFITDIKLFFSTLIKILKGNRSK